MNNVTQNTEAKKILSKMNILHLAICVGPTIFALSIAYIVSTGTSFGVTGVSSNVILIFVCILFATSLFLSKMLYRKKVESINPNEPLSGKLTTLSGAFMLKLGMLEAPALLCIVAYMMTANFYLLFPAGLILIIMFLEKPTVNRVANDLNLSSEEIQLLN